MIETIEFPTYFIPKCPICGAWAQEIEKAVHPDWVGTYQHTKNSCLLSTRLFLVKVPTVKATLQ